MDAYGKARGLAGLGPRVEARTGATGAAKEEAVGPEAAAAVKGAC